MSFGLIPLEKPVPRTFDTASFAAKILAKKGACASGLFFKKTYFRWVIDPIKKSIAKGIKRLLQPTDFN